MTYRELMTMLSTLSDEQLSADVTVEISLPSVGISSECYAAHLSIADKDHDGGLDVGHPVIVAKL